MLQFEVALFVTLVAALITARAWSTRHRFIRWVFPTESENPWSAGEPKEPASGPDLEIGSVLLEYVLVDARVHRRVEKLTFTGVATIRRQVSVDVTLPEGNGEITPIGLAEKRPTRESQHALRDVDVSSAQGARLSLLGYPENSFVAWSVICHALLQVIRSMSSPTSAGSADRSTITWTDLTDECPALQKELWRIVASPSDIASSRLRRILDEPGAGRDPLEGSATATPSWTSAEWIIRTAVSKSQLFEILIRRLSSHYLLVVQLPPGATGRTVLKLSLADSVPVPRSIRRLRRMPNLSDAERALIRKHDTYSPSERRKLRLTRALMWLGAMGESVATRPLTGLPAGSTHFEVHAPEGTYFTYANLGRTAPYRSAAAVSESLETVIDDQLDLHPTLSHTFLNDSRLDEQLRARLTFRPRSARLCVSGIATVGLAALLWKAPPQWAVKQPAADSLLLLVPPAVGGWVVLQQHSFVQRILRGPRMLLMLASVVALTALSLQVVSGSAATASPDAQTVVDTTWWICRVSAATLALLLIPVTVRAWPYTSRPSTEAGRPSQRAT